MRTFLPLIVVLAACEPDAAPGDAERYADALRPVLTQNLALSQERLAVATALKRDPTVAGAELDRVAGHYAPAVAQIARGGRAIQPATSLTVEHAALVAAWEARSAAYGKLSAAATARDAAAWKVALGEVAAANEAEGAALAALQARLGESGVQIDPWGVAAP